MKDVLIVDDDRQTLDVLIKVFAMDGYAARGADSARDAIAEIDRQCPDILISDWDLGTKSTGVHVVMHAVNRDPEVYVVMISGNHLQQLKSATRELPIRNYIRKPFSLSEIRSIVSEVK